jgi:Tol biopolymer transport system component/tRNA A-37 threonylcarbamoyl transferase component Bud32
MAMNPERLRQIEELYHLAGERPPGERETFLTEACGNDADLKRQVLALLAQDSGPMERPVLDVAAKLLVDSSWTPGTQVGPYQIVKRLGEGGMGEVFKARDTRLGREVAIKTAHEEFSGRFQREVRAISSLNHTNICTLYDVGPNYLVMELVEGANLAGPVPIETAIGYARQIAAGLEAAHEKGIIHRDLKPANIKVSRDGVVKILDFGLAKATQVPATESATVSMTEQGLILGTAAYMSPEQARGEVVDKRADIWAFGVILYELLTGKMLFGDSKNVSDVIAAVLTREPDFATLPKDTPSRVRRLLEACLRKDPKQRLRDIGDVRIRLDEPEPEVSPVAPPKRRRWLWAAGFAGLAVVAAGALYRWQVERTRGPFQRIQITRLTDSGKATAAAISPDGKYVLHAVTDEGKSSLWLLHAATGSNVQILPPVQGSFYNLNFSRDGNSLCYVSYMGTGTPVMYTMPVLGGNARTVAAFPGLTVAVISPDEKRLAFPRAVREDRGLFIANLDGSGERQLAARKAPDQFYAPAWSPDGKTIAYGVHSSSGPSAVLAATPVEGGPERRISSRLHGGVWALRWMPGGNGLIATANPQYPFSQLWCFTYPGGQARSITNDLNSYSGLSLTGDGSALVTVQNETVSHLWVVTPSDPRSAREISTGRSDGLNFVAFAGNGNLYFEAPDSSGATQIWSTGPEGAGRRQITTGESNSGLPAPCGDRHLVFFSFRAGAPHIFLSDLDGGNVRQLTNGGEEFQPSCSPDGTWLTYVSRHSKSLGVWRIPPEGGSPVRIWDQTDYSEISPDGKSVLVTGANGKVTILPAGGGQPVKSIEKVPWLGYWEIVHWSADGTALLYGKTVGGVTNIWQRPLNGDAPQQLTAFTTERITAFAVSRDGKRLALARGTTSSDVVLIKDLK